MTGQTTTSYDPPEDLQRALTLVRALWCQDDVSERIVAWAMMIEAVNRLTVLHGPVNTGYLLEQLIDAVHQAEPPSLQTVQ